MSRLPLTGGLDLRLAHVRLLDHRLYQAARQVRVLGELSWDPHVQVEFLESWRAGRPELPRPTPPAPDLADVTSELRAVVAQLDEANPLEAFLGRTARSYLDAVAMVCAAGTPAFTERSVALYGHPKGALAPGAPTHLDAADRFMAVTAGVDPRPDADAPDSEAAASWLREQVAPHFRPPLRIEVHPGLKALATAGAHRVRLRAGTQFSEMSLQQLFQHEAMVHAATKRNGRAQPVLRCMGLSSPRTTTTQEGLATLAELITDCMDLHRLRRVALRVPAIHMALEGADFIQVFEFLLDHGQTEDEACSAAARVFRGGDVRGHVAFTKDVVYLKGLMLTHSFLLKAMQHDRPQLAARLFAGRMTLGDVLALDPFFDSGVIIEAGIVPDWIANWRNLAAYLAWASFSTRLPIRELDLSDFAVDGDIG